MKNVRLSIKCDICAIVELIQHKVEEMSALSPKSLRDSWIRLI